MKFQWAIISKFNIALSVVNVVIFHWVELWPMVSPDPNHCKIDMDKSHPYWQWTFVYDST